MHIIKANHLDHLDHLDHLNHLDHLVQFALYTWSSIYRVSQKTHFKNCHELASTPGHPIDVVAGS